MSDIDSRGSATRFGFWAAVATPILTVVTFGLPAMALMLLFVALIASVHQ